MEDFRRAVNDYYRSLKLENQERFWGYVKTLRYGSLRICL